MDPRVEVARLAVGVMVADGRIERRELAASVVLDRLGLGGLTPFVRRELERLPNHPIDVEDACQGLRGIHPEAAATLVGALAQVAACDGTVSFEESRTLDVIGRRLGLTADDVQDLIETVVRGHPAWKRHEEPPAEPLATPPAPGEVPPTASDGATEPDNARYARRLLGVAPDASREAIAAAYLEQIGRYDPAKVSQLGAEFAALAVRKLFEATLAYETLAGMHE
jgi:uncharacterized tellurite resistance protein B-like protein